MPEMRVRQAINRSFRSGRSAKGTACRLPARTSSDTADARTKDGGDCPIYRLALARHAREEVKRPGKQSARTSSRFWIAQHLQHLLIVQASLKAHDFEAFPNRAFAVRGGISAQIATSKEMTLGPVAVTHSDFALVAPASRSHCRNAR
jgi:hypothetical protein